MKNISKGVCLLFLLPIWVLGQNLMPPIQNYRLFDYKASSKNWGLTVSEDGELFVANNQGLLHFNGEEWVLNKLPNNTTIRSVAYIDDRIYTGSYEEFGYWEKTSVGSLQYTSLTHLIQNHEFTSEEFWQIVHYQGRIVFRSFSDIYSYENDKIDVLNTDLIVSNIAVYNERIIVASDDGRLFWLSDGKLVPSVNSELLLNKTIIDMVETDKGLLVGTKLNGCYILKEKELSAWEEEINTELKLQQLNKILLLASGKLAFGTIKNGIYLYDSDTDVSEKLNRETGLQNNTVLSLLQFKDQLWAGLDNGIDRIQLNNPITYYTDNSGVLGTVYDLAIHQNTLYLGSNTGIYYFKENELQFVNGTQGHVWDLEVLEGNLLGGHNTGTFLLEEGSIKDIFNFSGGYQFAKVPDEQRTYLQGTYNGLVKFQKLNSGDWTASRLRGEVEFPVEQLCFENKNTIWAAHSYKGFYRVEVDEGFDEVLEIKEYHTDTIPGNFNIELFNIKNQIVFFDEGMWYKYDPILDRIDQFKEFERFTNKKLLYHDDEHFWFLSGDQAKEIVFSDFRGNDLIIAEPQLARRQVPEAENIVKYNDSTYYFTLGDGFGKIDLSKLKQHLNDIGLPVPKLSSFSNADVQRGIGDVPIEITFARSKNIQIKVTSPSIVDPKYYYELQGGERQSGFTDNGTLNLQNLPYGDYILNVSTVGIDNKKSEPLRVEFQIAPPWYLSTVSLIGYLLAVVGIIFLIRAYNRRKLRRKQKELKDRLMREQEDKLAQIEKEKLAKEIKLKQNELTISAMSVAEKNELLLELKNMLVMSKDQFSNQQRYRAFMKKLDNSIHGDEDWKRFEYNFNELHEDFFEKLLKQYPKLTPKDLKLCAYLKMNLSTKEIAPLMAISVRGVEIHRYRLRKKLHLDSAENISNFLITLK
ncbi:MAG: Two component regulator three Y domain-containing protein [Aurantibacter sp.]